MTNLNPPTPMNAVVAKTTTLVTRILSKAGAAPKLLPSDSLTDAGVSSLDMVNLMLAVEAEFEIFIPADRVNPGNFRSIASISQMIEVILGEPASSAA
jgi:acyl carrier protein